MDRVSRQLIRDFWPDFAEGRMVMAKVRPNRGNGDGSGKIQAKQVRSNYEGGAEGSAGLLSDDVYEKMFEDFEKSDYLNPEWPEGIFGEPIPKRANFPKDEPLPVLKFPEDPWYTDYERWLEEDEFVLGESDPLCGGEDSDLATTEEVSRGYEKIGKTFQDVNGFYKSARYVSERPFRGKWGIFLNDDAIHCMATRLASVLVLRSKKDAPWVHHRANALASMVIEAHEFFHYRFDLYARICESMVGVPLYRPLKKIFSHHRSHATEESLANQAAWICSHYQQTHFVNPGKFFYHEFKKQPNAYREFDRPPVLLRSILAAQLHDRKTDFCSTRKDLQSTVAYAEVGLSTKRLTTMLPPCPVYHLSSGKKGGRIPKGLMVFL